MEYDIQFCTTDDGRRIAFAVTGEGPALVISPGAAGHLELAPSRGPFRRVWSQLAGTFTLVQYDRAGTGLSQRNVQGQTADSLRHEIEAVTGAAGLERFALAAMSAGGPAAIEYVLHHPDRVSALVLYCTWAGRPGNRVNPRIARLREFDPVLAARERVESFMPSGGSREYVQLLVEYMVLSEGAEGERHMDEVQYEDQRPRLQEIVAPTLVLHRLEDKQVPVGFGRQLASLIPNARFVPLQGGNHIPGNDEEADEIALRIRDFLQTPRRPDDTPRLSHRSSAFRTILFTDVVASTPLLAQLKDAKMREVMRDHDEVLAAAVADHGGRVIKTIGDAFMAEFAVPSAAVEAAIAAQRAIRERFASSDVPVRIRIGINAGEPIEEDGDLHGASVVIAKRLESLAGDRGILVSDVVKQAVAGKDFSFEDRGLVDLKGFDEPVRAWGVRWE